MSRISALPLAFSVVIACPSLSDAQAKDAFVDSLIEVTRAADGTFGDEGPALLEAIDAMAAGLASWDVAISRAEAGLASEIAGAPAPIAARMRAALGTIYLERGRVEAAVTQFDAAVALDPGFGDVHLLRSLAHRRRNRPADEGAEYRHWRRKAPENPLAAYKFLRATDAASPEAEAAMAVLAAALDRAGEAGAAPPRFLSMSLLDEASVPAPMFPRALYVEAVDLVAQARYDEAVLRLREAARADPLLADRALQSDVMKRTAAALRQQSPSAAIADATAAAALYPSSAQVHRILGMAYRANRQIEQSLAALRTAVRLDPRDERSRAALADVLLESGNPAGARDALGAAVEAIPDAPGLHWRLGQLHQTFGDERSALRSFESAASHAPLAGAGHVQAGLGRLQHNRLDLDAAAAAYARRLDVVPNDSEAHVDLGDVLRAQEQLRAALVEYLVAALLDPTNANAMAMIGLVHASEGRDAEAARMLRRAVTLDPAHLQGRYGLSRALLRLGQTADARRELQIFQQLQSKAMEQERRRFEENQKRIDDTLATFPKEPGR